MNSHQRRELHRAVERELDKREITAKGTPQSIPRTVTQEKAQEAQSNRSKWWKRTTEAHSVLLKVLLAITGILGVGVLGLWPPKISVDPNGSLNQTVPFQQQFSVQNSNLYTLKNVQPKCWIKSANARSQTSFTGVEDNIVIEQGEFASSLVSSAKITATCPITSFINSGPDPQYTSLEISIQVDYELPLPISVKRCWSSDFVGKRASDKSYLWTYKGAGTCVHS